MYLNDYVDEFIIKSIFFKNKKKIVIIQAYLSVKEYFKGLSNVNFKWHFILN